jgi:hypothetical protein
MCSCIVISTAAIFIFDESDGPRVNASLNLVNQPPDASPLP